MSKFIIDAYNSVNLPYSVYVCSPESITSTVPVFYEAPLIKRIKYNINEETMKQIYRLINKKLRGEE